MSSTFGDRIRMTIFGESHGPSIGIVLDGLPAGVPLDLAAIEKEMKRRAPGQSKLATPRKETDSFTLESVHYLMEFPDFALRLSGTYRCPGYLYTKACQGKFQLSCCVLVPVVEIRFIKGSIILYHMSERILDHASLLRIIVVGIQDVPGMVVYSRREIGPPFCSMPADREIDAVFYVALDEHHTVWLAETF